MSLLLFLSDPMKLRRTVQMSILLPTMIPIVESVHASMPAECCEAEKRAAALACVERITVALQRRHYLSADMQEGMHKVIDDLYEVILTAVVNGK